MIRILYFCDQCARFWRFHPALLYGLLGTLAFTFATFPNNFLFVPLMFIVAPLCFSQKERSVLRLLLATVFGISVYIMGSHIYRLPVIKKPEYGLAKISIQQMYARETHFGKQFTYRGKLISFLSSEELALISHTDSNKDGRDIAPDSTHLCEKSGLVKNGTFCMSVKHELKGLSEYDDQYLPCKIHEGSNGSYVLRPLKSTDLKRSSHKSNWPENQFHLKELLKKYLAKKIEGKRSLIFLSGIVTGIFDDRLMPVEFNRFGLQHIMAISGFHFSLLAFFLSILLRLFFTRRAVSLLVLFFLSLYFIFLGCSPSILRAWVASFLFFLGQFLGKSTVPLNSLGVALLIILFIDPLMILSLGFQFSFLVTASILFFYRSTEMLFSQFLAKRSLQEMMEMSSFTQHAYLFLVLLRQGFALSLAVNVAAIPFTLYCFHKFPLFGFVYNFFFPLFTAISMFFLLLGLLTVWAGPLNQIFFSIGNFITERSLDLVYNLPITWDIWIRCRWMTQEVILCYLSFLFLLGIYFFSRAEKHSEHCFSWI